MVGDTAQHVADRTGAEILDFVRKLQDERQLTGPEILLILLGVETHILKTLSHRS